MDILVQNRKIQDSYTLYTWDYFTYITVRYMGAILYISGTATIPVQDRGIKRAFTLYIPYRCKTLSAVNLHDVEQLYSKP